LSLIVSRHTRSTDVIGEYSWILRRATTLQYFTFRFC